ncbi:MAG: 1-acyl-sn-glycerol-3-phosphate acyltransferase [Prevotella sp.]|jgi:1-acyl-sn-glycerol-3-phosphate acyltransferase|nr:1-acyl-sn-glycerol-3-phosphate acyltransferase [Prevotella sp.]MCI2081117.1 1-acyl-sn-glycerol-3-phosphate acyltransferase [Prevotella sp.]MCI2102985.1 1-acyl-sn-glycerol-3-phosphate acyltransferase [Prevotella sp.]HCN53308.1 1-acyl-sn-glycerol-3-phosphate acyltransferase [Prevotella sp.]
MKYLYRLYCLCIAYPIAIVYTILTGTFVTIGCFLGDGHFWGYYPGKWWAKLIVRVFLLPVKVEGRENLDEKQSYVFVSNHQGAFDIFLIYGFLNRNFKWMMKRGLRRIPFVGLACEASHQIFVDKSGPSKIRKTYEEARKTLKHGMSVMVFPEGSRSFTGHMGVFRRGAFMLADELNLPVVPLTINGSFNVMPRTRDWKWVLWHPMRLTIHRPIHPIGQGAENIQYLQKESYEAVMSSLDEEYQGFVENPDQ